MFHLQASLLTTSSDVAGTLSLRDSFPDSPSTEVFSESVPTLRQTKSLNHPDYVSPAGQPSYRAVHQFFYTRGRSLYILVLDLTQVLHLSGQELRRAVMQRTVFWVESLLARAPGAVVKVVLSKADSLSVEECVQLLRVRSIVRRCLETLVTGFLEALKSERDMLKARERGRELAGGSHKGEKTRLEELDAAIASGGLEYPETDADILIIGVPPRESLKGFNGAGSGHTTKAEAASGSDQLDESMWDRVLLDMESPKAKPSQPGSFQEQPASFTSGPEWTVGDELFAAVDQVQAAIVDLAAIKDSFTITFPASWVRLIDWVEGERDPGSEVGEHAKTGSIEWQAYAEKLSGDGKQFGDERSLRGATEVLHDLGYLLYYGGDGELGKHVFLYPQKVINLLKVVVQHNLAEKVRYVASNNLIEVNVGGRRLFEELKCEFLERGLLDHRMLPQVWPGILDWGLCKALLELLERFDLAYCSKESTPERNKWGSHGVPSRWPETPSQSLAAMFPLSGAKVVSRRLHFDRLLPEGIFEQLLVRCLGVKALSLDRCRNAFWRSKKDYGSGACFDCQGGVCVLLLMTRDLDQSGDSETMDGVGGTGELPGDIFVMGWESREGTNKAPGNESTRPHEAVCIALGALVPLLNTRFPGIRFQEEVICHRPTRRQGWSDEDLIRAGAGEHHEVDSRVSFKEIVSSIRVSTGWRSLQEENTQWWCGTCQEERDVATFVESL
jgi:hypothetical protein